ncbi:MAG TPA: hypothetical protein VG269_17395 [Tepidisphaeraceae bacterium]|jgi:hypothetical protein|nr:hypothetical protein [Tepidisphaeraceae bacterium]
MIVQRGRVIAESGAVLLARVQDGQGNYLTNATTSGIVVNVYNAETAALSVTLPSGDTTIYDTLQTSPAWTQDSVGYNVSIAVPGSAWPTAATYRVEAIVTPVAGDSFFLLWELYAVNVFSA